MVLYPNVLFFSLWAILLETTRQQTLNNKRVTADEVREPRFSNRRLNTINEAAKRFRRDAGHSPVLAPGREYQLMPNLKAVNITSLCSYLESGGAETALYNLLLGLDRRPIHAAIGMPSSDPGLIAKELSQKGFGWCLDYHEENLILWSASAWRTCSTTR